MILSDVCYVSLDHIDVSTHITLFPVAFRTKMLAFKRSSVALPLAFSVQPSMVFDRADGQWSTFNLGVGDPAGSSTGPQNFRVVVSTSSFDVWLPTAQPPNSTGCPPNSTPATCASMRGVGLYDGLQSTGYAGNESNTALSGGALGLESIDVGSLNPNTLFGTEYGPGVVAGELWADYLQLTTSTSPSTPYNSLSKAPIFGIKSNNYYLASLGVGSGVVKTTITDFQLNSTLTGMAADGVVSSRSWGYTAGAYYG